MKKGIHPAYHFVDIQLNDGTTYKTRTTYGEAGQKITLDIDPTTHPAWTGGQQQLMDRGGRLTRFNKKFAGFVKLADRHGIRKKAALRPPFLFSIGRNFQDDLPPKTCSRRLQ